MYEKSIFRFGFIFRVLIISGFLLGIIQPAVVYSQSGIASIRITSFDYTKFPIVSIQAQVLDSGNMPVFSLSPSEIVVSEDNVAQAFEHRSEDKGVQVAFVLDMGSGISLAGATGDTRIGEMKNILTTYIEQMGGGDQVSIFSVTGEQTTTVLNLESDKDTIRAAISTLGIPPQIQNSYGLNAVFTALEDLKQANNGRAQALVFISGGIQSVVAKSSESEKIANSLGISIYSVLVRPSETASTAPPMRNLAINTKGLYTHYSKQTDTDEIFKALKNKRAQYIISYRASSSTLAERVVELKISNVDKAPSDYFKYTVNLSPAQVTITQPSSGTQFLRKSEDAAMPIDAVEPTSAVVSGYAAFADNYPRNIRTAELIVDGASVSTLTDPGTEWNFPWDLRAYRTFGEHNPQLTIKVTDELGIVSISDPSVVSVVVDVPSDCTHLSGGQRLICESNKVAGVAALIIALVTFILVVIGGLLLYRNREKLMQVGGQISEAAKGTWERMTGGAKEKPSAYLTVMTDMYRQTLGDKVEIYQKTDTPIGRNPMTNKIVIQDNREQPEVSKEHVIIRYESSDKRWYIKDMSSTNGTKVNSVPLKELDEEILDDGAEITLGRLAYGGVKFQFNIVSSDDTYMTADQDRITH